MATCLALSRVILYLISFAFNNTTLISNMLFLSFWDIGLENFPVGVDSRKLISPEAASSMIDAARSTDTLLCVCDDQSLRIRTAEREKHVELCAVLREHYQIHIALSDFFHLHEFGGYSYSNT